MNRLSNAEYGVRQLPGTLPICRVSRTGTEFRRRTSLTHKDLILDLVE